MRSRRADLLESALDPHLLLDLALQLVFLSSSFVERVPRIVDVEPIVILTCRKTIYAPMIHTVPCIMFWMRAYPLLREVGGGWALEFESFLGPVKWQRADRRVPFRAQKTRLLKFFKNM
jgi:hypothetical protein